MAVSATQADVKLRIYLKDGSLQAGNLITENTDNFVILTKDGRIEIPKDKIMFVNGKSLAQWEMRPDKTYSTEIMPPEIPSAAFVNDKAANPVPIDLGEAMNAKKKMPKEVPVVEAEESDTPKQPSFAELQAQQRASQKASDEAKQAAFEKAAADAKAKQESDALAAAKAAEEKAEADRQAVIAAEQAAAEKAAQKEAAYKAAKEKIAAERKAKAEEQKARLKKPEQAPVAAAAATPVKKKRRAPKAEEVVKAEPVKSQEAAAEDIETKERPQAVSLAALGAGSRRFNRKAAAETHYAMGMEYLGRNERGRALQELHFANTLDKWDEATALQLGKLYKDDKVYARARKYLDLPSLRKKAEVAELVKQMDKSIKLDKFMPYILGGGSFLGWTVCMIGWAFFRRRKPAPVAASGTRVFTAENVDELQVETQTKTAIEEIAKSLEAFEHPVEKVANGGTIDFAPVKDRPKEPPQFIVQKPDLPKPVQQPPAFKRPEPPPAQRPPEPPFQRSPEPARPPEPLRQPEPIGRMPSFTPPPEPLVPAALPPERTPSERETVLRMADHIDESLLKGHGLAGEGKYEEARRCYRTALSLDPYLLDGHLGMAYLSFAQGQMELALEHYSRGLGVNPNSAEAHYGVGRVYLETERIDEAVMEFQRALALNPALDEARTALTMLEKPA